MTDLITTPAEIERLAAAMIERQARSGRAEEQPVILHPEYSGLEYDTVYTLILRPAPGGKLQLLTTNYGRHWPQSRRAELAAAFGVTANVQPDFAIHNGWQITKWTWMPAEKAEQSSFLPAVGSSPTPGANNYKFE